jgi:methionine aminopeptidase
VKEATNAGIAAAGIDVQMCEIGEVIQEVSFKLKNKSILHYIVLIFVIVTNIIGYGIT